MVTNVYRVIRSTDEAPVQGILPYAENILQDCARNKTLIPANYYNVQTGESYNYMYVKSVVSKSGNAYMCPVSVGKKPDVLLVDSSSKIKVSLSQIEQGKDRTELKWENVDPKFTLDYVVNRTKQWLNKNLPKLVGRVSPVLSRRYLASNRYGRNLWIKEDYEYVMLVDKADYDVKTDKNGVPNFTVNLTGHIFDVGASETYYRYEAWKRSDSLYPYYLGYDSITLPLHSIASVTYPGSSANFPSKDIVLNTIDNLNLSKDDIDYAMSELVSLAEKGSYIPSATTDNMEAWLVPEGTVYTDSPGLVFVSNGKPIRRYYDKTVVFWKDNNGYAIQYRKSLFYFNDAKDIPDDFNFEEWNNYRYGAIYLNKALSTMIDEN